MKVMQLYIRRRPNIKNNRITTIEITIFGKKSGKMDPIPTDTAFMIFIANDATRNNISLLNFELRTVIKKNVLSPTSENKIRKYDCDNPSKN